MPIAHKLTWSVKNVDLFAVMSLAVHWLVGSASAEFVLHYRVPLVVLVLLPRKPARRHPVRVVGIGAFRLLKSRAGYGAFPIHYAHQSCNRYPIGQLQNPNSNR